MASGTRSGGTIHPPGLFPLLLLELRGSGQGETYNGQSESNEDYEIPPITPPNLPEPSLLHLGDHEASYHSLCHGLAPNGLLPAYSYQAMDLPAIMMSNMLAQDSHLLSGQLPTGEMAFYRNIMMYECEVEHKRLWAWALMQMLWREDNPEPVIRKKPGLLKLQKASSWRGFLGNSAPEAEQKQKAGAPGGSIDPGQGGPGPVLDSKNPPTNEAHVWRSWEHGMLREATKPHQQIGHALRHASTRVALTTPNWDRVFLYLPAE
ncbi:TOX high mobility group box family member 2 [Tupaia chinensis]|uniref:TOX high mobility group box family member 2 n=1 Tax=Tupaia chinensis TaxID=246437 RepID=L9KVD9_TUPCH|nr:TOX high mobility group box family member 2 [Tupaia chinensis]